MAKQPKVLDKQDRKKAQAILEDKTFGIKNKKGSAQQKQISQIQKNLHLAKEPVVKKDETDIRDVLNSMTKITVGGPLTGPKSAKQILCVAFKMGKCTKGNKCKFSHDMSLIDPPPCEDKNETDEEIEEPAEIVKKPKVINYTKIICKFFIEACEKESYGKFWKCPNGLKCIYVHMLPEGYVLEREKKLMKEQQREMEGDEYTIDDYVEEQLQLIYDRCQEVEKLTEEQFLKWKDEKRKEKAEHETDENSKKSKQLQKGKFEKLSGKEIYELNMDKKNLVATDNVNDSPSAVFKVDKSMIKDENGEEEDDK